MIELYAENARLSVRRREALASGSVDVYQARFGFSEDWEGLTRKAAFMAGGEVRSVVLDGGGACAVPWEVLAEPGRHLFAGVYGTREEAVRPTVWADLGMIEPGAAPGPDARPPTRELWRQELAQAVDGLSAELERIPEPVEALTNQELEELLK